MNRCRFANTISSYMDHELPEAQRQAFEAHMRECQSCSRDVEELTLLSQNMAAWRAPEAGPGFAAGVQERIVREELEKGKAPMKKNTLVWLAPSTALVAVLAFVVVGQVAKSAFQGRMRDSVDQMGMQFAPGKSGHDRSLSHKVLAAGSSDQYEPYYMQSDFKPRDGRFETSAMMDGGSSVRSSGGSLEKGRREISYDQVAQFVAPSSVNAPLSVVESYGAEQGGQGSVIVIQPALLATGQGDKIIRTAEIKVQVGDGKVAYQKASAICQELGEYLANSRFYKDEEGREAGTLTMRIPKDKFLIALEKFGGLGMLQGSTSDSRDVAQEYANLKSQYDAAMVVYNKMLEALNKRQVTIPDAMRLESEITPVLVRVQNLKNQIDALDNAVSFTTVTVNFYEPAVSAKVLKDSKRYISDSILIAKINAVKTFAKIAPAFIPVLIVLALCVAGIVAVMAGIKRIFKKD